MMNRRRVTKIFPIITTSELVTEETGRKGKRRSVNSFVLPFLTFTFILHLFSAGAAHHIVIKLE